MNSDSGHGNGDDPTAGGNSDPESSAGSVDGLEQPPLIHLDKLAQGRVFHCQAEVEAFLESLQAAAKGEEQP